MLHLNIIQVLNNYSLDGISLTYIFFNFLKERGSRTYLLLIISLLL